MASAAFAARSLPPAPPNPEYYPKNNCPKKHIYIYNQQFKRHRALFIYTKTFSEVKMKTKRIITLAICLLTLIGIFHSAPALAAGSTVTIESQTNSAFDYLEYYSSGSWHDLNTPRHWIEQTGEVVYCMEHSAGNPAWPDIYRNFPVLRLFGEYAFRYKLHTHVWLSQQ